MARFCVILLLSYGLHAFGSVENDVEILKSDHGKLFDEVQVLRQISIVNAVELRRLKKANRRLKEMVEVKHEKVDRPENVLLITIRSTGPEFEILDMKSKKVCQVPFDVHNHIEVCEDEEFCYKLDERFFTAFRYDNSAIFLKDHAWVFVESRTKILHSNLSFSDGPKLPELRFYCKVMFEDHIWIIGGEDHNGAISGKTIILKNGVFHDGPGLIKGRRWHTCSTIQIGEKSTLIVVGGNNESEELFSVEILNEDKTAFVKGPAMPFHLSTVVQIPSKSGIYLFGREDLGTKDLIALELYCYEISDKKCVWKLLDYKTFSKSRITRAYVLKRDYC